MTTSQVAIGVWFVGAVVLFIAFAIWPSVEALHWLVPAEAAWAALVSAFYDGSSKAE